MESSQSSESNNLSTFLRRGITGRQLEKQAELNQIPEPDSFYAWVVCAVSFLVHFVLLGGVYTFSVFLAPIREELGETIASTSWVTGLNNAMMLSFAFAAGRCVDAFGFRLPTLIGGIFFIISYILSSFIESLPMLYLTYGVGVGISMSFVFVPAISSVVSWFERRRGVAVGFAVAGSGVGNMALAPIVSALIEATGSWRLAMRYLTIFYGLVILLAATLLRRRIPKPTAVQKKESPSSPASNDSSSTQQNALPTFSSDKEKTLFIRNERRRGGKKVGSVRQLIRDFRFWLLFGGAHCASYLYFVPFTHIIFLCEKEHGIPLSQAVALVSVFGAFSTAGRIIMGYLADGLGPAKMMAISTLLLGGSSFGMPFVANIYALGAMCAVFGSAAGAWIALLPSIAAEYIELQIVASAMGLLYSGSALGVLFGPPIVGALRDATGSYDLGFVITSSLALVGACILFALPGAGFRHRCTEAEDFVELQAEIVGSAVKNESTKKVDSSTPQRVQRRNRDNGQRRKKKRRGKQHTNKFIN